VDDCASFTVFNGHFLRPGYATTFLIPYKKYLEILHVIDKQEQKNCKG
jgi:hypothetical protein